MTELEATIADLRIAVSLTKPGECLDIPRVRVIELLDEIARLQPMRQRAQAIAAGRTFLAEVDMRAVAREILGES